MNKIADVYFTLVGLTMNQVAELVQIRAFIVPSMRLYFVSVILRNSYSPQKNINSNIFTYIYTYMCT